MCGEELTPVANVVRHAQFGIRINGCPRPNVTPSGSLLFRCGVLVFRANKAPDSSNCYLNNRESIHARNADHSQIVVLTEVLGRLRDSPGVGAVAQERLDLRKPEKYAVSVARLGDAIGQQEKTIADTHLEARLAVAGALNQPQRQ